MRKQGRGEETECVDTEMAGAYLFDHLMAEDLVLVEDLNGDDVPGAGVASELDLAERPFPQRPSELVRPHSRPSRRRRHPAHLPRLTSREK